MRYFEYHHHNSSVIELARESYSWLFDRGYSLESIEVRYVLLEYLRETFGYVGRLEKDISGKPIPIVTRDSLIYWSVSHSKEYLCFIVSNEATGIDIAEYTVRDPSVLSVHRDWEYSCIGKKDWKNFYTLWSAKEAIIKRTGCTLDDMKHMFLTQVLPDDITLFAFLGETYRIQTMFLTAAVISYIL